MRKHKRETITLDIDIELWNIKNRIGQVNSYDVWAGEAAINGEIVARVGFQDKCPTEEQADILLRQRLPISGAFVDRRKKLLKKLPI